MTRRDTSSRYYRDHQAPFRPMTEPGCGTCQKTDRQLARTGDAEGCAYIGCHRRKTVTAAPAQRPANPIPEE